MTPALDAVLADALMRSPQERAELAEALADSVLPAPPLRLDREREIALRVADMEAGRTHFVAGDEALAALAERIASRRPRL